MPLIRNRAGACAQLWRRSYAREGTPICSHNAHELRMISVHSAHLTHGETLTSFLKQFNSPASKMIVTSVSLNLRPLLHVLAYVHTATVDEHLQKVGAEAFNKFQRWETCMLVVYVV